MYYEWEEAAFILWNYYWSQKESKNNDFSFSYYYHDAGDEKDNGLWYCVVMVAGGLNCRDMMMVGW